jgi:hypothetical protein
MDKYNEHEIQNAIRLTISEAQLATCFRANVGEAYIGDSIVKNSDGSITITKPRRFNTGLPKGFTDLLCVIPVTITADMVGQTLAIAGFIEVKTPQGRVRKEQKEFIECMQRLGARAGVARSPEDAIKILKGD